MPKVTVKPAKDTLQATEPETAGQVSEEKDPYWVDSLAQGLAVLHAFDAQHPALSLTDIAKRLNWGRSKPYRFVHTLERLGYLTRDSSGRVFRLTTRSMQLGFAYLSHQTLVELAQPILDGLRQRVGASTHLAVLEHHELVYLALSRSTLPTGIHIHVGSRMPAVASSIGKLLLAHLPESELDVLLGQEALPALTPKTTVDPRAFRHKLSQARSEGYMFNDEEYHLGIRSIAAPVFNAHSQVVAGINATALTQVFTDERVHEEVIPAVQQAAAELSAGLGHELPRKAWAAALRGESHSA